MYLWVIYNEKKEQRWQLFSKLLAINVLYSEYQNSVEKEDDILSILNCVFDVVTVQIVTYLIT